MNRDNETLVVDTVIEGDPVSKARARFSKGGKAYTTFARPQGTGIFRLICSWLQLLVGPLQLRSPSATLFNLA